MGFLGGLFGRRAGGTVAVGGRKWRILDIDGAKNAALLISKEPVTNAMFHEKCTELYESRGSLEWENCTLRAYLNGTLYNNAFSPKEKEAILTTTIRDKGRPATQDRLFLLSQEEAEKYFRDDADRKTTGRMWWLRDTVSGPCPWPSAMTVLTDGKIKAQGNVADEAFAVRPAMWVDLNKL